MKKLVTSISALFIFCITNAQKTGGISLADAIQVDSSNYFIIPHQVETKDKEDYGKGKGYFLWGAYSNITFFNTATNQSKNLFQDKKVLISAFREPYSYYKIPAVEKIPNFFPKHIVYLVRSHDFNKDGALDSEDPVYLYVSDKTGNGLRQVTPDGYNVISYTASKDGGTILVKTQKDSDGNKKFRPGDDDIYFKIEMNDDTAKIKCLEINLQSR